MARTTSYEEPTEVVALRHRLERILDSTVAAVLEHDHPADVVNDPQIRRLLISVRQQDGALADRAWWRIESAAAARLIELAELADEQTVAAAAYLQQVAAAEEDGFEELPGGTMLFRCPVDGCDYATGITGPAEGGDSDADVQAVIDFHEQVFAHEALHDPRGELLEPELPTQRRAEPTPTALAVADAIIRRAEEDDAQAVYLAQWAQRRPFRRARTRWLLGLVVMLSGVVVGAFATPPADGRTVLALLLIGAGFVVGFGGARRMQQHAERPRG